MTSFDHYPYYPDRVGIPLPELWDFAWCGEDIHPRDVRPADGRYTVRLPVPGCFDLHPDFAGFRGTGCYRTAFEIKAEMDYLLKLDGIGMYACVFIDDEPVETCALPFTPYEIPLHLTKGLHTLAIAVNNRFGVSEVFFPHMDFYCHGGIYRAVMVCSRPAVSLERVYVKTLDLQERRFELDFVFSGKVPVQINVELSFDGGAKEKYTISADHPVLICEKPEFGLWSPDHPELHTVEAEFENDRIVERFGLRTIEAKDGKILLNGDILQIRGINRHDAHPDFGYAVPAAIQAQDIAYIKDLGCNFIRGGHYPQNQRFLDLCDENGILFWEETIGSAGHTVLMDETFLKLTREQAERMVHASFNHPAVIIWGFFNEGESEHPDAADSYSMMADHLHKLDSTRLVTAALRVVKEHLCTKNFDLIAFNGYPAWSAVYDAETKPLHCIGDLFRSFLEMADSNPDMKGKPIMISETGASAIYGVHDRFGGRWSEEFQADVIRESADFILNEPRFAGIAFWLFCDARVCTTGELCMNRPRGFNNKGMMDEYRRPKLAYRELQNAYRQEMKDEVRK